VRRPGSARAAPPLLTGRRSHVPWGLPCPRHHADSLPSVHLVYVFGFLAVAIERMFLQLNASFSLWLGGRISELTKTMLLPRAQRELVERKLQAGRLPAPRRALPSRARARRWLGHALRSAG
jgi:hypothetical protein